MDPPSTAEIGAFPLRSRTIQHAFLVSLESWDGWVAIMWKSNGISILGEELNTAWWLSHVEPIPLKNISQLGWLFLIYGRIKMFQTTNQNIFESASHFKIGLPFFRASKWASHAVLHGFVRNQWSMNSWIHRSISNEWINAYPLVTLNSHGIDGPFIDGLPIKNGDFPWQTVSHNQRGNYMEICLVHTYCGWK